MPHTNRRKKSSTATTGEKKPNPKILHTTRQYLEDDDGWIHIVDTPRQSQVTIKEGSLHTGDFERNGVAYVERTLEDLKQDLEYYTKLWESGEACEILRERLSTVAGERLKIGDVVCLGLSSLQSARREGRRRSFVQLAALRSIVQILGTEQTLQCVFQDPQFTDLDKEFLASLGYTVVDDPLAFEHITDKSLVYAIHCYAQVYKSVAEGPRPAMLVGTDVDNFGKFNLDETMESIVKSLEDMVQDCDAIDFPQVRHDFSDTKIYWRKMKKAPGG